MFREFLIQIKTNWVSVYGAVFGTIGLILSLLNYFRDRAKIKIKFRKGWVFIGSVAPYKNNTPYDNIKVINFGRRPISIEKAGARIEKNKKGKYIIISDNFVSFKNKILTELNPAVDFYYESSTLNHEKIYYLIVYDATGRKYIKWIHPVKYFWRKISGKE